MSLRLSPLLRIVATARPCNLCRSATSVADARGPREENGEGWKLTSEVRPDVDMKYIEENIASVAGNIQRRKGDADVYKVVELWKDMQRMKRDLAERERSNDSTDHSRAEFEKTERSFLEQVCALPNDTHPDTPMGEADEPALVEEVGSKRAADFPLRDHTELGDQLNIIRTKNLGHITGHRSYYLRGVGAQLERALVRYTLDRLVKQHNFRLISVPDIIEPAVFEGCGMRTKGLHTQVYRLNPDHHHGNMCLAGTAEVGIAGYLMNQTFDLEHLPLRIAAASRCFRAETASSAEARGLFRVHQFTKVEMFGVTAVESSGESEELFHEFVAIQRSLFQDLGLHFQILDMPAHDLGSPAYRKYDMEAWMPGRGSYGEISSASNCTDYQSRRLGIKYLRRSGDISYAHTLNGTACAVPRLIISILENFQQKDGSVAIPEALQPFMHGQKLITKPTRGSLHLTRL